jgi:hypothetical protein
MLQHKPAKKNTGAQTVEFYDDFSICVLYSSSMSVKTKISHFFSKTKLLK